MPTDAIVKQMSTVRASNAGSDEDLVNSKQDTEKSYDQKQADFERTTDSSTAQAIASAGLAKGDFSAKKPDSRLARLGCRL